MTYRLIIICALGLLSAITIPAIAQNDYFETEFETFEATQYVDSLYMFEGSITNLQNSELRIVWQKTDNLANDSWYTEICQLTRYCWPDFVRSDTIILAANQVDTLQIKLYPHSVGVGETSINLVVVADNEVNEELSFRLTSRLLSVRQGDRNNEFSNFGWVSGKGNIGFKLPISTSASLTLFDIRGSQVAKIWNGSGVVGSQSIPFTNIYGLPSGVYLLQLEANGVGAIARKITLLR